MSLRTRTALGVGLLAGLLLALSVGVWWLQHGPTPSQVRRTVITTVQEEAPASFLVTGTLDVRVTVEIDSAQYATPDWLTYALKASQPAAASLLKGVAQTTVQVPGRVSYGFEVQSLTSDMITVEDDETIAVDLPALSVHSVEPDLTQLKVKTTTEGWMRVFPSDVDEEVRKRALSDVEAAFRTQAQRQIDTATQSRINTARALEKMLTPPLKAAGVSDPRFRIWVGERLTLTPEEGDG